MPKYTIRPMIRPDMDLAMDWADDEGWNLGLHDVDASLAQDPGGFLIGELDNEPVGCISAVSYEGIFGFIGFYIVAPEFRGQGYGIQLWRAAMDRLKGHIIGLDGVLAQQDNYRKSGFEFMYRNIRFEYANAANPSDQPSPSVTQSQPLNSLQLNTLPFEQVAEYDQRMFEYPRPKFLRAWLNMPETVKLAAIREGRLTGYGVLRKCRTGYKIGPLFADHADTAEQLFIDLCSKVQPGEKIYLDVPECNEAGMAMAERYATREGFDTARMYSGGKPNLSTDKIFGVTNSEFG